MIVDSVFPLFPIDKDNLVKLHAKPFTLIHLSMFGAASDDVMRSVNQHVRENCKSGIGLFSG